MTRLEPAPVLVLACGALARELRDIVAANGLDHVSIECLASELHNRPDDIPAAVEARLDAVGHRYHEVLIGYADCGTGGRLDEVCQRRGLTRLPGAHCYEFYAGPEPFAQLHDEEPGTFYLTDFLARHFDRLVYQTLGLDRHPQLRDMYFGNYRRVVYLAQRHDPALADMARRAAERLGLAYEYRFSGYGQLAETLVALTPVPVTPVPVTPVPVSLVPVSPLTVTPVTVSPVSV